MHGYFMASGYAITIGLTEWLDLRLPGSGHIHSTRLIERLALGLTLDDPIPDLSSEDAEAAIERYLDIVLEYLDDMFERTRRRAFFANAAEMYRGQP
jgi:hypothetical protein